MTTRLLHILLKTILASCLITELLFAGGGPVQPEAAQFEPVDVTDVVNLATGDFVYTLPLIEVPGPEGGYPIVLSYHAGIGPNQEATWVGLGWSLNPGSINRILSGYPDDFRGDPVETHYEAFASGEGLGLSFGYGPVGINMSFDFEKGLQGASFFLGIPIGKTGLDAGVSLGTDGASVGLNYKGIGLGASFGNHKPGFDVSYDFGQARLGVGVGERGLSVKASYRVGRVSTVGFDLSTNGSIALSVKQGTGFATMAYAGEGEYSSFSFPFFVIPTDPFISLSYSGWSYVLDETHNNEAYGYLNQGGYLGSTSSTNIKKYERINKGRYLYSAQDIYQAAAQGVGGTFMPFARSEYTLYDQQANDRKAQLTSTHSDHSMVFRFLDDPGSNYVTALYGSIFDPDWYRPMFPDRFASKKIEPSFDSGGKIIGFTITDVDGTAYRFGQPIRNLLQYAWASDFSNPNLRNYCDSKMTSPYATSWLLTGVIGPDYVDRGSSGMDEQDWGYWVKLTYALTSSSSFPFMWRAPFSGTGPGATSEKVETYAFGLRDVVYLDNIETATHIAVFAKSPAKDRQMASDENGFLDLPMTRSIGSGQIDYSVSGNWYDQISASPSQTVVAELSVEYRPQNLPCNSISCQVAGRTRTNIYSVAKSQISGLQYNASTNQTTFSSPRPYQTSYEDFCTCTVGGEPYDIAFTMNAYPQEAKFKRGNFVRPTNLSRKLDRVDLYEKTNLAQPIRSAQFSYAYTLCSGTPNSLATPQDGAAGGKLTLTSVQLLGQDGFNRIPPYVFEYANGDLPGSGMNPGYNPDDWDDWGSYRDPGTDRGKYNHKTPQNYARAARAAAWSLTRVRTPTGGEIDIEYEADRYHNVSDTYDFSKVNVFESQGIQTTSTNQLLFGNQSGQWLQMNLTDNVPIYQRGTPIFIYTMTIDRSSSGVETVNYYLEKRHIESVVSNSEILMDAMYEFPNGNYRTRQYLLIYGHETLGGGIRVKSMTTFDGSRSYKTSYDYTGTDDEGYVVSSGTTASIPWTWGKRQTLDGHVTLEGGVSPSSTRPEFVKFANSFMDAELSYGRPSPGVIYWKVTVTNVDLSSSSPTNGKTIYWFHNPSVQPYNPTEMSSGRLKIDDRSLSYGQLVEVAHYEMVGNDFRRVSGERTDYAFSNELFDRGKVMYKETAMQSATHHLGLIQERYSFNNENVLARSVVRNLLNVYPVGATKTLYFYENPLQPLVPTGSSVTETKTFNWDALSGAVLASASKDSKGETQISRQMPAYWVYSTSDGEMLEKNMLTQLVQETNYRSHSVDLASIKDYSFPTTDVISSTITSWSNHWTTDGTNQGNVWRINDTYVYDRKYDYTYPDDTQYRYTEEDYPQISATSPWRMISNITKYDRYSHPTEERGLNNQFTSSIYGHSDALPIALASNAKASEIGFTSLEVDNEGWEGGGSTTSSLQKHAGQKSSECSNSYGPTKNFYYRSDGSGIDKTKSYILEAWVRRTGGSGKISIETRNTSGGGVGGVIETFTTPLNEWYLVRKVIPASELVGFQDGYYLRAWCGFPGSGNAGYVDDIRFYPADASMSTYTYDPLTWKLTSITDKNNITTYFEYDEAGRLVVVRDGERNILKRHTYKYALQ